MTSEQQAIIQRIGELSARFDAAAAAHQATQAATGHDILNIATAMVTAINQTGQLVTLQKQYGDALRELLDTL